MKPDLPTDGPSLTDAGDERRVWRGVTTLMGLLCVAIGGYFWQGIVHQAWGWSLLVLLVSAGSAIAFWRTVASGRARTTWGEFERRQTPFAFWLTVALCLLVYLGSVTTMFVTQSFSSR